VSPSSTPALGESVSDMATATGVAGFTPTGTVTITLYQGSTCGTALDTYSSVPLGSAQAVPNQPAGEYSFMASSYSGDNNYQSGTSSGCESFTVQQAQASISTLLEPSSSDLLGTSTYDTATIGGTVAGFTPTGSATYSFYSNSACGGTPTTQTVTLSGGDVPQSTSQTLAPGVYSYGATYSGDSNYLGAPSGCEPLAIQTPTTSLLVCLPFAGAAGVPESCTVLVANNDLHYDVRPSGTVTFSGGPSGMPASCVLSPGSGIINACSVSWTPASGTEGSYSITAYYGGDTTHAPSSAHTSLAIFKRVVSVSVSCSTPLARNTPTTCTVTVKDIAPGTPITPTGAVSFSSSGPGTFSSTSCTLSGGGSTATCHVTFTPTSKGTYTITASYAGDADHYGGFGSTTFKITK